MMENFQNNPSDESSTILARVKLFYHLRKMPVMDYFCDITTICKERHPRIKFETKRSYVERNVRICSKCKVGREVFIIFCDVHAKYLAEVLDDGSRVLAECCHRSFGQ